MDNMDKDDASVPRAAKGLRARLWLLVKWCLVFFLVVWFVFMVLMRYTREKPTTISPEAAAQAQREIPVPEYSRRARFFKGYDAHHSSPFAYIFARWRQDNYWQLNFEFVSEDAAPGSVHAMYRDFFVKQGWQACSPPGGVPQKEVVWPSGGRQQRTNAMFVDAAARKVAHVHEDVRLNYPEKPAAVQGASCSAKASEVENSVSISVHEFSSAEDFARELAAWGSIARACIKNNRE